MSKVAFAYNAFYKWRDARLVFSLRLLLMVKIFVLDQVVIGKIQHTAHYKVAF